MRIRYHSDNGAPCWKCKGTIYSYVLDSQVSYVAALCIACTADNMFYPPRDRALGEAAQVSAAHRESYCPPVYPITNLQEQRMASCHQWGMRDQQEGRPMIVPCFLRNEDERVAYMAGYNGAAKRAAVQS